MKRLIVFSFAMIVATTAIAQTPTHFDTANPSGDVKRRNWIHGEGTVTLWDNGMPDGVNGYSNATVDAFGARRTLLGDFTVPAGDIWDVVNMTWNHVWGGGQGAGFGTGLEMQVVGDAGGPDLGNVIAVASVNTYSEVATGNIFFSRPEIESFAEFDPINLTEGTYWFEATVVGADNNFWLTAPVIDSECWVNYDDFAGLEPCSSQFGVVSDLSYRLGGVVVPVDLQSFDVE